MALLWKAEVTSDMVTHLNEEQRTQFMRDLSDAVNAIGQAAGVGREYKDGKLLESQGV